MPIPLNQVTQAEIVMRGVIASGGSNAVQTAFVFHFRRLTTTVNPTKAALAAAFNTNITPSILAALNARYTQTLDDIRWLNDAQDPYVSTARAGVGAIAGDSLATDQAAYLLYRSALRGRSYRGSKHLAPMSESDVGDDIWNAGALGRLAAINTALLTGFADATANNWVFCILTRKLSQLTVNPTTVVTNDATQGLVNKRIGSMNQRKVASTY